MTKLRAYCELVRLPNVFTAMADILAGYWLSSGYLNWSASLGWLLLASASLYSAGIVFNDLHDIETDRRERPGRPLPSGRIAVSSAWRLAIGLTLIGLVAATLAGLRDAALLPRTTHLAVALVVAILAYDFWLKESVLGPFNMAACRALNFLMPVAACPFGGIDAYRHVLLITIGVFLYVASLTYFGRDEATRSGRGRLIAGGLGIAISIFFFIGSVSIVRSGYNDFTLVLWLALTIQIGRVTLRTIRTPTPAMVQYAMKTFVLAIIAIDAVVASSIGGWQAGTVVLALLVPTLVLGRWVYST